MDLHSSKSHLLPSLFNALHLQRTLLNNTSKLMYEKSGNNTKYVFFIIGKKTTTKKHLAKKSFSVFEGVLLTPLTTLKLFSAIYLLVFFSRS